MKLFAVVVAAFLTLPAFAQSTGVTCTLDGERKAQFGITDGIPTYAVELYIDKQTGEELWNDTESWDPVGGEYKFFIDYHYTVDRFLIADTSKTPYEFSYTTYDRDDGTWDKHVLICE